MTPSLHKCVIIIFINVSIIGLFILYAEWIEYKIWQSNNIMRIKKKDDEQEIDK